MLQCLGRDAVMRKGAQRRDWTTDDLAYLRDAAGRIPAVRIAQTLDRSYWSVTHAAERLGISLRCSLAQLVWCNECASWRSGISKKTGQCRVCRIRDQLAGREAACAETLASMTAEQRITYAKQESGRGTRASSLKQRPKKRESCPVSMYERSKAEAAYLLDVEEWEYRRLKLPYDAAKTRLRRMRELTGTNPRKNKMNGKKPDESTRVNK